MKKIKLTKGQFALVDSEDFEWLNQWKWCADDNGYAVRHERKEEHGDNTRKMRKMHREILSHYRIDIEGMNIDHKNNKEYDNRKKNLRIANCSQNMANSKLMPQNTSGYKGVIRMNKNTQHNITKPWATQIYIKGKRTFKGMFETKEEAARAYNELAKKYFGEFARLNQIGGDI